MRTEKTESKLIIPDSSVMIKWCVREEEDHRQILEMQEDFANKKIHIVFPALLEWELNNYLGRKFSESGAAQKYSYIKLLRFTTVMLSLEISSLGFKIMKKYPGVSFYDASYHALALQTKGIFLTADKKYYDRVKNLGNIRLLKDY